mgnify:CR=1 FL=1
MFVNNMKKYAERLLKHYEENLPHGSRAVNDVICEGAMSYSSD